MTSCERFSVAGPAIGCQVEVMLVSGRVTRVQLTHEPAPDTLLSAAAAQVRETVERHLKTGAEDFSAVPVDLTALPPFWRATLETLQARVPAGEVVTYGQLAALVGRPGASRAVGGAMRNNPIPFLVPCHRVVASGGKLGEYSGAGSTETKRRLLQLERAPGF